MTYRIKFTQDGLNMLELFISAADCLTRVTQLAGKGIISTIQTYNPDTFTWDALKD